VNDEVGDLEQAIDELCGVDRDELLAARTRLAKRLREVGRREEAGQVAKLRKPSLA
jgi:hypothetical protein